ncbi:MAG TPA: fructose-1,6-bisphosphate aldolase/phosphatase [Terriglobales bacterium]|nr:fructose-1,6-bisphosphate aldolase/phosphatase [Terriglobales bacterium]
MKTTLTVIKADVGSVGGHIAPSKRLLERVAQVVESAGRALIQDHYIGFTGDDIAILMTHDHGVGDSRVHKLAWDAFVEGTEIAKEEGLYGAGQDLLKDSFSGNVKGLGPACAEMEIDERPNEPFLFFAADKTDPGAFNLPLFLTFADVMTTPGLILSPNLSQGFRWVVMDVGYTEGDRVVELVTPEEIYDLAALLRDNERFVVESVWSRATGEQAAAVATSRLHNIAGRYTGKDDPVMLVRSQMNFPATGEILAPFSIGHYVAGGMRGSHNMPLMPVPLRTPTSYFDGPPLVSCAGFCVHNTRLTEPADCFAHPFWDEVRSQVSRKAMDMRRQGFSGAAMLPMAELEYTGVMDKLARLEKRFTVREEKVAA